MASSGRSASGDAELIAAIKAGDLSAFTELVVRHQRALVNFFYHFSWDRQAAEDCAQEVFVKLYVHLDSYEPQAKFTTFLYRVARNLWIDRLRSSASTHRAVSLEQGAGERREESNLKERLPATSASPVDILSQREAQQALLRTIDALPEEQRLVVVLSELQGLKYNEIADILGVPVGTVKSRMHTAIGRLKELMTNELR